MCRTGIIILAAGGSTRMGRPKQLLPWKGRSLLRHACETALGTSCRPVVVLVGCQAEICAREIEDLNVVTVENSAWQKGLGSSISEGIRALEIAAPHSTGVLIMLVDQPSVTTDHLNALVSNCSPGRLIAATKYPDAGGVPAVFDRALFGKLRSLGFDRGAHGLINDKAYPAVLIDQGRELFDLDTPEIYQEHAGQDC